GIGSHLDVEPVAAVFADEAHQFVGVVHFARIAPHARRQVAPQRHDSANALGAVAVQNLHEFSAAGADAGKMRGGGAAQRLHQLDGVGSTAAGGSPGTVSDADIGGFMSDEPARRFRKLGTRRLFTWREKLQADGLLRGHWPSNLDSSPETTL